MKKSIILIATLLASTGQAADYYVANNGNDANSGSINAPWKTIDKVNSELFFGGDTIHFKGGDTFDDERLNGNDGGTAGNPITFTSYGTGQAIFSVPGENYCMSWVLDKDWITIKNLYFDGCGIRFYVGYATGKADNIVIEDNVIDDAPNGMLLAGVRDVLVKGNTIIGASNGHGIYLDGTEQAISDIIVEDNDISDAANACIQANSNGVGRIGDSVIRYNRLHGCAESGVNNVGGEALEIHHNLIYDVPAGIYNTCNQVTGGCGSTGSVDTVIENNSMRIEGTGFGTCLSNYSQPGDHPTVARYVNNLCIFNAAYGAVLEVYGSPGAFIDNNWYWTTTNDPNDLVWDVGGWYEGFDDYQGDGNEPNSGYGNPTTMSYLRNNFYPINCSPLIDTGAAGTVGATRDFNGTSVPYGGVIDIGAVENNGYMSRCRNR